MKPVLVSGSLAYDRIMDFPGLFKDHFLADALHNINVSFLVNAPGEQFGGCAGNIAYSLALAGGTPEVIAMAGCDFAKYEEWLSKNGVGVAVLKTLPDRATSSAYIITDSADNQIAAFSPGAGGELYDLPIDAARYELAIVGPADTRNMMAVVRAARASNIPYLFDPGQQIPALSAEDMREAVETADGLLVNDYELKMVMEKTGWSEADIVSKVGFLIVTLGKDGSRILTKGGEERVAAVSVENAIDPTGAGDAFRSGFIRARTAGLPLPVCAKLGSAVAAYAVECYGTQNHRFTLPELKARYESAYNESLPI